MLTDVKYYLIHGIDASRKPFMENQFETHGIPNETVKWINWPNKYDTLPEGITTNASLPKGNVAVTYKHYLILKDICDNQYPLAVIMEDNIEFRGNVPTAIERYLKDLPPDWDCVFDSDFLGKYYDEGPTNPNMSVYKKSNEPSHGWGGASKGAHFVLLNLKAAQKLCAGFMPFCDGSDHQYKHIIRNEHMNVFWAEPPNVHKIDRPSTWKDDPVKNHKKISWINTH